ncbi:MULTISPECIES: transporter substrate-binding domain-containing protein [unclassified Kitasatospora]|uniref:transporter substrate-binding domain-containing protein n=1 Tax=unclassified Kitasatospora TaxID=2633591 RepID=UPI003430B86A
MRRRTAGTRSAAVLALLAAGAAVLGGGGPSGAAPASATGAPQAVRSTGQDQAGQDQAESCDLTSTVPPSTVDGPAVKAIKAKGTLIIGVDQNSYRWGARNPNTGELEGFDIDLARAIGAAVMGDPAKVVLKPVSTAGRVDALTGNQVDLIVRTMTISCANLKKVAFSRSYFNIKQRVLVPRSSTARNLDEAISGRTVCAADGSVAKDVLNAKKSAKQLVLVTNQLDCLVRMQLGKVDATMTDDELAVGQAAQDQTVKVVDGFEQPETIGVAMRQNSTDLTARVNQVISDYYADKDKGWQKSFEQWVQPYLPENSKDPGLYWPAR